MVWASSFLKQLWTFKCKVITSRWRSILEFVSKQLIYCILEKGASFSSAFFFHQHHRKCFLIILYKFSVKSKISCSNSILVCIHSNDEYCNWKLNNKLQLEMVKARRGICKWSSYLEAGIGSICWLGYTHPTPHTRCPSLTSASTSSEASFSYAYEASGNGLCDWVPTINKVKWTEFLDRVSGPAFDLVHFKPVMNQ